MDIVEFVRRASQLVAQVAESGRAVLVQRAGHLDAVLISAVEYQTLQRLRRQRQGRFRRDLERIHRAADEATLVNDFSEEQARDVVKQALQSGHRQPRTPAATGWARPAAGPSFAGGLPLPLPGGDEVPHLTLDAQALLTYLVGAGKDLRPLLDAWAEGHLEVLVPRFVLLDLRSALAVLAEAGCLDIDAGESLLDLLVREGEPVPDPLIPPGFLPGWRGRLN